MCRTVGGGGEVSRMQQQHGGGDGDLGAIVRSARAAAAAASASASASPFSSAPPQLPDLPLLDSSRFAPCSSSSGTSAAATSLGGFMELMTSNFPPVDFHHTQPSPPKPMMMLNSSSSGSGSGNRSGGGSTLESAANSLFLGCRVADGPLLYSPPRTTGATTSSSLPVEVKREPGAEGAAGDLMMHDIFSHSRAMPCSFVDDIKEVVPFVHDSSSIFHHRGQQQQQPAGDIGGSFGAAAASSRHLDCGSPSSLLPSKEGGIASTDGNNSNNNNGSNSGGSTKQHGSKRSRKMQQKRIVYVPVTGGGKPTGEVLPSDMWAWRKYGQKPIKGSPYPRGYYRCSSSKGCSARKQVERNRNDPTMLIITYTSEHNHPWPAHRNSLAGTTRIRPMTSSSGGAAQQQPQQQDATMADTSGAAGTTTIGGAATIENPFVSIVNSSDPMQVEEEQRHHLVLGEIPGFDNTSRSSSQEEDFFSELEELPELSSILEKGFLEYKSDDEGGGGGGGGGGAGGGGEASNSGRTVDPFNLFSWSSASSSNPPPPPAAAADTQQQR